MTSIYEAKDAIAKHFLTGWGGRSSVNLENEDEEQPKVGWVRLAIRIEDGGQETLGRPGNRRFERTGRVYAQLFLPENTGTKTASEWTQAALDIFEGVSLAGTTVRFGQVYAQDRPHDGQWHAVTVAARFAFDETK